MTVLRVLVSGLAIVVGFGVVLVTVAMGDCSTFGGPVLGRAGFPMTCFGWRLSEELWLWPRRTT